jgi:SAM-dependent methyltransferase
MASTSTYQAERGGRQMPTPSLVWQAAPPPASGRRTAIATADELHRRQQLYDWQKPRLDLPAAVVAELPRDARTVLDVGCGNGRYLRWIQTSRPTSRVVGIDISPDMLEHARRDTGCRLVAVADAQTLPCRGGTFDAALAMHVLYLLPDPRAALAELFRVVRAGGVVIVGTSARDDKQLVARVIDESACGLLPKSVRDGMNLHRRFDLATATAATRSIASSVWVREFRSEIRLASPEPLVAYVRSLRPYYRDIVGRDAWDRFVEQARVRVAAIHAASHGITIPTHTGIVIGRVRAGRQDRLSPDEVSASTSEPGDEATP